jgi:hypothetical protein
MTGRPRLGLRAIAAVGLAALGGTARADERSPRPPVRIELDACLDRDRDAIERAMRIELGEPPAEGPAVVVQVACAPEGPDDGVVLEVRPPDSPRRYRYALRWRAQPLDARPRLLGLAVAEAVDASRIELTAVPELPPPARVTGTATVIVPGAPPSWRLSLFGERRSFVARDGFASLGVGLMLGHRLSRRVWVAADLSAETTAIVTPSGAIQMLSLSSAPRLLYRAGGRLHAEIGGGVRVGAIRMVGEALPGSVLVGRRFTRAWFGPEASVAIGIDLTPTVALKASVELGVVVSGVTGRDLGEPVAAIDGEWTSFAIGAAIAL